MITKISGNLIQLDDDSATLDCAPFEYQVFIAESTRRALQSSVGQAVSLHTIYYHAGDPAADVKRDVLHDAFEALRMLGHSDPDARKLIDAVLKTKRKYSDVEAVLQAIYQQSHGHNDGE